MVFMEEIFFFLSHPINFSHALITFSFKEFIFLNFLSVWPQFWFSCFLQENWEARGNQSSSISFLPKLSLRTDKSKHIGGLTLLTVKEHDFNFFLTSFHLQQLIATHHYQCHCHPFVTKTSNDLVLR